MKKIAKMYTLYEIGELSKDAFKHAYDEWYAKYTNPMTQSIMCDECSQMLKADGIQGDPNVMYSLSNCQGDGVMFEGRFTWNGYSVSIKHSGRYYHSNSKTVDIVYNDGNGFQADDRVYEDFEKLYQKICKKLEKFGYDFIEDELSEGHFVDECFAYEWLFTKEGMLFSE